jgi:hypothetical protein
VESTIKGKEPQVVIEHDDLYGNPFPVVLKKVVGRLQEVKINVAALFLAQTILAALSFVMRYYHAFYGYIRNRNKYIQKGTDLENS